MRIQNVADFLAKTPHPDQAIEFLSAKISPFDEIAVAYRGTVDSDGLIRCENLHGFSKQELMSKSVMHISEDRPISIAARAQKIVWTHIETVNDEFKDFYYFDELTPWQCMMTIPIGLSRIYAFSFPSKLSDLPGVETYFEAIQSLLRVYESSLEIRRLANSRDLIAQSELQPLTVRQEKILELLRAGKTNKSIAYEIGYSESLVRHETMIIYKKLRVEGRHELRESV
jgi:DNA-binding CsgD family transcriptional regulator